jgi:hypothetical protein
MRGAALDFVISKVAMSVCALIVASILGPVLVGNHHPGDEAELECMMTRLCGSIATAMLSGVETDIVFPLTTTSSGSHIRLDVRTESLLLSSETEMALGHPCTDLHLWRWNGSDLRTADVAQLDLLCGCGVAATGQALMISTRWALLDSAPSLLAFASISQLDGIQSLEAMSSMASASATTSSTVL